MPDINTLVPDIYGLFDPDKHHVVSEDNLEIFAEDCKALLRKRLEQQEDQGDRAIRFSSLGKPDRQIWFDSRPDKEKTEKLLPKTYIKFLYGDLIEQLMLFLAREAGHDVTDQQKQVEIDGVTGSIDCKIDGVLVDVKSASSFGYKKFENNTVEEDDPFGYVAQLAGYATVETPGQEAAWLANDKVGGDICVSVLPAASIEKHKPDERIAHLKEVVASDDIPPVCYPPVPDGKSGNEKLATPCSYCKHKFRCWPDVKTFYYSTGPRYLTKVVKQPKVSEFAEYEVPK